MKKITAKLISVLLVLTAAFSFAACDTEKLSEYKVNAKAELEVYVQSKGEENYTEWNWHVIMEYISKFIEAIDVAESKEEVDIAISNTKKDIDAVAQQLKDNEFNAVMHSNARAWMYMEFLEQNLTYGTIYFEGRYIDQEESRSYPSYRIYIIKNQVEFEEIFSEFPPQIDFEKEMIVVYIFTDYSPRRLHFLTGISLTENTLNIRFSLETPLYPDAATPQQRCLAVKMKKISITDIIFTKL